MAESSTCPPSIIAMTSSLLLSCSCWTASPERADAGELQDGGTGSIDAGASIDTFLPSCSSPLILSVPDQANISFDTLEVSDSCPFSDGEQYRSAFIELDSPGTSVVSVTTGGVWARLIRQDSCDELACTPSQNPSRAAQYFYEQSAPTTELLELHLREADVPSDGQVTVSTSARDIALNGMCASAQIVNDLTVPIVGDTTTSPGNHECIPADLAGALYYTVTIPPTSRLTVTVEGQAVALQASCDGSCISTGSPFQESFSNATDQAQRIVTVVGAHQGSVLMGRGPFSLQFVLEPL